MEIPNKKITRDQLDQMFENIAAKSGWDMSEPKLWGYFFTHDDPEALDVAKDELVARGFRFVDIYQSEKDDEDEPDLWWLHVEREEVHTPASLDARNDELYVFAHEHGLDAYDGMDVGPIEK